jgi:hypothetical protein
MASEVTDTTHYSFINGKMGEKFTALNYSIPCLLVILQGCFGHKAQRWAGKGSSVIRGGML